MTTETVLTDAQIFDCFDRECAEMVINFDADELYPVGRAVEQAVLQSPEVQALRKDAEISRWLRDNGLVSFPAVRDWMTIRVVHPMPPDVATFDEGINAAMEKQQ